MALSELDKVCSEFASAVNAGDLDALADFYALDAVFVSGQGTAAPASGRAAIREALAGFLASHPVMEFEHTYCFAAGDTAVARGKWKMTSTGPDGSSQTVAGNSIEVLKRQPDGSWRYVIDHPWGGD